MTTKLGKQAQRSREASQRYYAKNQEAVRAKKAAYMREKRSHVKRKRDDAPQIPKELDHDITSMRHRTSEHGPFITDSIQPLNASHPPTPSSDSSWDSLDELNTELGIRSPRRTKSKSLPTVLETSLVIIHLFLSGISTTGCPAVVMFHYLRAVLHDKVQYHEVEFNIENTEAANTHNETMVALVGDLLSSEFQRVVIFISTVSDERTGELQISIRDSAAADDNACVSYLHTRKATIFVMAGEFSHNKASFGRFIASVSLLSLENVLIFTAPRLHATLTAEFIFVYARLMLKNGLTLNDSMEIILSSTSHAEFFHNSGIIHLYPKHTTVFLPAGLPAITHHSIHAIEYLFAHDEFCPWGTRPALICPQCSSKNSWSKPTREGSTITLSCKASGKGKECTKKCSFEKPDGMRSLGVDIGGGKWMALELK